MGRRERRARFRARLGDKANAFDVMDKGAAHFEMGKTAMKEGRAPEAMMSFQAALEAEPKNSLIHFELGNGFVALYQLEPAIDAYSQAVLLSPNFVDALINLGSMLYRRNRFEEATEVLDRALQINPDIEVLQHIWGTLNSAMGEHKKAETAYKRVNELSPSRPGMRCMHASALSRLERVVFN